MTWRTAALACALILVLAPVLAGCRAAPNAASGALPVGGLIASDAHADLTGDAAETVTAPDIATADPVDVIAADAPLAAEVTAAADTADTTATSAGPSEDATTSDAADTDGAAADSLQPADIAIGPPCSATACDDGNACTDDSCDPVDGCAHLSNAATCADGNACTDDSCDFAIGCVHADNANTCDDGSPCTSGDACAGGACKPNAVVDCNDGDVCTDDSCDFALGCVHIDNTNACDDGSPCTVGDACAGGACKPKGLVNCSDGSLCTDDSCDFATGCVHSDNTNPCDDGNLCTVGDACAGGVCKAKSLTNCDDGNLCTDDACDAAKGCVHLANAAACNIGDACVQASVCVQGTCLSGWPVGCDDGDACTDDACTAKTGCSHQLSAACSVADVTSGDADAANGPSDASDLPDTSDSKGSDVADGFGGAIDVAGSLDADTSAPAACAAMPALCVDDGDPCTVESCDPVKGCLHTTCAFLPNVASAGCGVGGCSIGSCTAGHADCNGVASDGCETDIAASSQNCGGCGKVCASIARGSGACVAGACKVTACAPGFDDCNGNAADGCETDLGVDSKHCGSCGKACSSPFADYVGCAAAKCAVLSCAPGFANCDGAADNGCETTAAACDTSPPAPITTLSAAEGEQVLLSWQSVGENGNVGTAARYVIKFSLAPITNDAEFAAATEFKQKLVPQVAGSKESVQVFGLKPRATYHFVVRAVDKVGNLGLFVTDAAAKAGSFALARSSVGSNWADYDRDGDLDLMGYGFINRNDGNGVFASVGTLPVPDAIAWVDENNDGYLDVWLGKDIYRNQGNDVFKLASSFNVWGGAVARFADYDTDGDADVLVGPDLYRNDGHGNFALVWSVPDSPYGITWIDSDDDGDRDLLVGNGNCGGDRIYRNDGKGGFTLAWISDEADCAESLASGDYDADGFLDFVSGANNHNSNQIPSRIYHNDKNGGFTVEFMSLPEMRGLAWGDFDNDGDLDLAGGVVDIGFDFTKMQFLPTPFVVYRNDGNGVWTVVWSSMNAGGGSGGWGDFDGDGDLDIVVSGNLYRSYEADFYGANTPPTPPVAGFSSTFDEAKRTVTLQFGPGSDSDPDGAGPLGGTPTLGLYYEIAVGSAPGLGDVVSPAYGSPLLGNHGQMWISPGQHGFRLNDPPAGKLYWRVRAIDAGLAAGPWSVEQSVFVAKSGAHGWPAASTSADTTGENVHELWFADATGASPKAFVPNDGWYTVLPSVTLSVTGLAPGCSKDGFTGVMLSVTYSTGASYEAKSALRWGYPGGALADTTIVPKAGEQKAVATFDLYAAGVHTKAQLQSLVLAFTNGSGSGVEREMSLDSMRVDVTVAP